MMRLGICLTFFIFVVCSCRQEGDNVAVDYRVSARLDGDPGRINPMFAGSSSIAREVYPYIFLQLGEYNPISLKLEPILAKGIPEVLDVMDGEYVDGLKMEFEILDDAVWADGTPITGEDYLFTVKAFNHPLVNAGRWRAAFGNLVGINIDKFNNKIFEVYFDEKYLLALEAAASIEILPAHIYDPENVLQKISLKEIRDQTKINEIIKSDTSLKEFAEKFNSRDFNVSVASGAGPYELKEWVTNQYILLQKKENWWGDKYPERPFLTAKPRELFFQIIPDENTAITQLKNNSLDVSIIKGADNFNNFKNNPDAQENFSFYTPQLTRFYYLGLNNRSPKLRSREVRKALAYLLDVNNIIEAIEYGEASRIIGPVPKFHKSYNNNLDPIDLDIGQARSLLDQGGWKDSNGDQIRDKTLEGLKVELSLRIFVSQSELGKRIALLLKENARQAGIEIEIIQKDFRTYYREHILKGDYELAALSLSQSLANYDPYPRWHSDNANIGNSNLSGFTNVELDDIIENIQETENEVELDKYYRKLQEILYEEQAVIFLYSPVSRIVVNKKFKPAISIKRPGYFVNLFEPITG